jgi:FkbM family methyltransferase
VKKFIKYVIGTNIASELRKIFPSKMQKEAAQLVKEDTKRRSDFYATFIDSGDLCFDVGANMGNRIEPLLLIGAKVVAVEPQSDCYHYLKEKFGKKISIVSKGLGETEGVKKFYVSNTSTLSSFSPEWIESMKAERFNEYTWNEGIDITVTTADKLINTFGVPSFIKIDVEGYELEVLKGLTQPIKMISFEYTVPEQTEKIIQCIDQIAKYNSNIECNYSDAEIMQWSMKDWLSPDEMKNFIKGAGFSDTEFGDIYVRTKG